MGIMPPSYQLISVEDEKLFAEYRENNRVMLACLERARAAEHRIKLAAYNKAYYASLVKTE